jgi:hypothetical protein
MKQRITAVVSLGLFAACAAPDNTPTAVTNGTDSQVSMSVLTSSELNPVAGAKVHHARGFAARVNGARVRSPNMTYHGGKIMPTSITRTVFWGTSWASYTGDKITGMDTFYSGWGGTPIARTNIEYTGTNGTVGQTSTYAGHIIDATTASGGANTTTILNEVCKVVAANGIAVDPAGNDYIAVYTDVPRGNAGYCAWHSAGTCGGKALQFAFFWKLDGDAGCDPGDTSGLHSQGLAAIANVSAHELSEAVTDPASPGAWYDASGNENSDKCAWVFNTTSLQTFNNGSKFKVQGNWSNRAYTAGTGYANSSGQKGCLNQF